MTHRIYRCGHQVGEPERIDADCLACQRFDALMTMTNKPKSTPSDGAMQNALNRVLDQRPMAEVIAECRARVMASLYPAQEPDPEDRARGYKIVNLEADRDVMLSMKQR